LHKDDLALVASADALVGGIAAAVVRMISDTLSWGRGVCGLGLMIMVGYSRSEELHNEAPDRRQEAQPTAGHIT
jgi:hypothetical protein